MLDDEGFHFKDGARGRNLLLSALAAPLPVFGEEVHPTLDEKAAALLVALMRNHPLADGNKRLAWFATVAFLELNELDLVVDDVAEADRFLREVAAGAVDLDAVAAWVRDRIRPLA
ncbi:type II toxin-antitoxin system death-on-curing family toxin [Agromyces luteolus]|uniref:Type II toxin-antitoxin system death-on-curing family toxin n=1 Tax=Agromyces luteolus TaxID=88373 RepID=A0A7C9HV74_9MICO|nr:type II toxin-antitoxin system death-on-curing family toxin [Agromyces luteolus]